MYRHADIANHESWLRAAIMPSCRVGRFLTDMLFLPVIHGMMNLLRCDDDHNVASLAPTQKCWHTTHSVLAFLVYLSLP